MTRGCEVFTIQRLSHGAWFDVQSFRCIRSARRLVHSAHSLQLTDNPLRIVYDGFDVIETSYPNARG